MHKFNNAQKISYYIVKELPTILLTTVFGVVYNVAFVFAAGLQGNLLDTVIEGKSIDVIMLSALVFVSTIIFIQVTRFCKRYFVRSFANKTTKTMRQMMYISVFNQDLASLNNIEVGDFMTRCIGDVDITVEGIRKAITEILDTGIAMIAYIAMLLAYDVEPTLIGCSFIVVAMLIAYLLKNTVYKYTRDYRESQTSLTQTTLELTSNVVLLKNHGALNNYGKLFEKSTEDVKAKSIKASILQNATPPIYKALASIGVIFIIYFGGLNAINSVWTVGKFTAYLSLFLAFTLKASKISTLFSSVQKAKISWLRTRQYLHSGNVKRDNIAAVDNIELKVDNLTFAYDEQSVFKSISFTASRGQIVGIVGKIASGKTSALLALSGQYKYGGSILLNDRQLNEYDKSQLSQFIAASFHSAYLLDDTIEANVTVGRDADVDSLLDDVCFNDDMSNMPQGKKTLVGSDGVRLSGGQQARISLARALVGTNKVVLLDDPFSAVDVATEQNIIKNIKANHQDKIFIIVSHRPTIYEYADKIIEAQEAENA